jgi:hypothetical protein
MRAGDEGTTVPTRAPEAADVSAQTLAQWPVLPCPERPIGRDVRLDLLRGLAMLILVVNHAGLRSWLTLGTGSVLSAAETLVPISGVAVGMVFGRRWRRDGGRVVTRQLWSRARSIYVAAAVLAVLVWLGSLVPGLSTDAVTVTRHGDELYSFGSVPRTLLAIVTLEAGPWQTCILAFFVVTLLAAPLLLWVLDRGGWPVLLAGSVGLYVTGRGLGGGAVLPSHSESPFPVLVWQLLFVVPLVFGFHRHRIAQASFPGRRIASALLAAAVAILAAIAVCLQVGLAPDAALRWQAAHFDKATLDPVRVLTMGSIALTLYLIVGLRRHRVQRAVGWLLLPLGRNSFYVFLVHVPLCVVLASVPGLAGPGGGAGMLGNSLVLAAYVGTLLVLVRRQVLFRWIPR